MKLSSLSHKSLDFIHGIERSKKRFNLHSMKAFLKSAGNPEKELKIVHVAGTNGKGSVCAMMSSALQEAGCSVGMYTSPHLIRLNERIQLNDKQINNKDLDRLSKKIEAIQKTKKIQLTFFETLTATALLYFKEKKVDYVVFETGMGGRLDATNAVKPILTVITNISKDHRDVLGRTLKKITLEKAGIIKKNIPLITNAKKSSLKIIKKVCKKQNAKCIVAGDKDLKIWTSAEYEKENVGTAFAALKFMNIPEKHIIEGLKKSYWPGRFEFITKDILVDCAHNPDGMRALVNSLHSVKRKKNSKWIVILGMMGDKDAAGIAKEIKKISDELILTKANMARAADPEQLSKYFDVCTITRDLDQALKEAKKLKKKDDKILITGSIFLVGEFLGKMRKP